MCTEFIKWRKNVNHYYVDYAWDVSRDTPPHDVRCAQKPVVPKESEAKSFVVKHVCVRVSPLSNMCRHFITFLLSDTLAEQALAWHVSDDKKNAISNFDSVCTQCHLHRSYLQPCCSSLLSPARFMGLKLCCRENFLLKFPLVIKHHRTRKNFPSTWPSTVDYLLEGGG